MNTIEKDFCEKLFSLCDKPTQGLVVAFSGGCDSLALLALAVKALGKEKVYPVYVNHNLRDPEELEQEIALNEANCEKIGVKLEICTIVRGDVLALAKARSGGVEDAARILRYEALEEKRLLHNCSFIATAHHRQDQVETIAMRLNSGSPVSSLAGIAQKDCKRHLLRPLLDFDRKDLEEYLQAQDFSWSTDSTNQDVLYARNRMRNEILPRLRETWPEGEKVLLSLGEKAKALAQAQTSFQDKISIETFKTLNPTRKTLALFDLWNVVFSQAEMPMTLVMRVSRAVEEQKNQRICANGAIVLIKDGFITIRPLETEKLDAQRKAQQFEVEFDPHEDQKIVLTDNPEKLTFLSGKYAASYQNEKSLRLNCEKFTGKPRLRYARMGDSIKLKGGTKKVLRLLQDMKIPQNLRSWVPVLVDDDGLCAVFGSCYGGFDRICVKFRSSLAPNVFTLYIVHKEFFAKMPS